MDRTFDTNLHDLCVYICIKEALGIMYIYMYIDFLQADHAYVDWPCDTNSRCHFFAVKQIYMVTFLIWIDTNICFPYFDAKHIYIVTSFI